VLLSKFSNQRLRSISNRYVRIKRKIGNLGKNEEINRRNRYWGGGELLGGHVDYLGTGVISAWAYAAPKEWTEETMIRTTKGSVIIPHCSRIRDASIASDTTAGGNFWNSRRCLFPMIFRWNHRTALRSLSYIIRYLSIIGEILIYITHIQYIYVYIYIYIYIRCSIYIYIY